MTKKSTQWKKTEVKERISDMFNPDLEYRLPSGFVDKEIKVLEDTFGNLIAKHVYKEG